MSNLGPPWPPRSSRPKLSQHSPRVATTAHWWGQRERTAAVCKSREAVAMARGYSCVEPQQAPLPEWARGPRPSIVDLPTGCWRLDLSWPGGEDRIYLRYLEPAP